MDVAYGGTAVTATIKTKEFAATDNKDGSYTFRVPMAFLAKVGTFFAELKIDNKTFVPDPGYTALRNPLPIITTPIVCSDSLKKTSTAGTACVLRTCPPPPTVANAKRVDPPKLEVKAVAFYICQPGYSARGAAGDTDNAQVQCDTKGQWGPAPVCAPFSCKAPGTVANAKVTTDKITFGGVATVACSSGFAGGGTAKCGVSGWTALPKCFKRNALSCAAASSYAIKSCGATGAASCVAAVPCQLKPEFKAATGGKDLALWGWTCSEDGVGHCSDGKDKWLTMNADGTQSGCPVQLTESAPLLGVIGVIVFVSCGGVAFVKGGLKKLSQSTTGGQIASTGRGAVFGGLIGFVDILSDFVYLIDLGSQRRLKSEFWISAASLGASMITNTVASILVLQFMTVESKDAKAWLKNGKNQRWASLVILASTSRVEGLEMLAYSGFGFPMRQRWADFIGYVGILTPLLEDAVQLYVVIAAFTKLDEWTTMAQVNLGCDSTLVLLLPMLLTQLLPCRLTWASRSSTCCTR